MIAKEPAGHGWHMILLNHGADPVGHALQASAAVEFCGLTLPGAHAMHASSAPSEYVPPPQTSHLVLLGNEKEPAGHTAHVMRLTAGIHPDGHMLHAPAATEFGGLTPPGSHSTHTDAPSSEYVPPPHAVHDDLSCVEIVPAGHATHVMRFTAGIRPGGHMLQAPTVEFGGLTLPGSHSTHTDVPPSE